MTEWKLQSYPEMLQALYQLKAATRIYRQERTAENVALMLEKFPAAAMACVLYTSPSPRDETECRVWACERS